MSLLNELEADARRSDEQRARDEAAHRARAALDAQKTQPAIDRAQAFLRRAAQALTASDTQIRARYEVLDLGALDDLVQQEFRVAQDPEQPQTLRFAYECVGEVPLKAVLANEDLARTREAACVEAGLICQRVSHAGSRRAIAVQARVPVSVQFAPDGGSVVLRTRNLCAIETRRYTLAPERVDEALLEALLEVILRRGNRLAEFTGDALSDAERSRLKRDVARRERRRQAEVGGILKRTCFPLAELFRRLVLRQ